MKLGRLRKAGPLGIALTAAQVAWTIREHWQGIPADRRERLQELLRETKGKPSNLSKSKRRELRKLVRQLNTPKLARNIADVALLQRRLRRPS
jgi:hypothetical protein